MATPLLDKAGINAISGAPESTLDLLPGAIYEISPLSVEPPAYGGCLNGLSNIATRTCAPIKVAFRQEADYGHLFYWTPVFMGTGAAMWFAAGAPPAVAPLLFLCIASAIVWLLLGPWRSVARAIAAAALLMTSGGLLAAWEAAERQTVILDSAVTTTIRGIITAREIDALGRWRYEVRLTATENPALKRAPAMVRVTALGRGDGLAIGAGLEGRARLSPPSGPALPGLNDFAFDAFFSGIGASGFFYGSPRPWSGTADVPGSDSLPVSLLQMLESLRGDISARIRSILPGDTGGFAASMVTDDRRAMSKESLEALRLAGLTHIIAISGLNMALAAGLCFVGLRMLLSLSQEISHSWPVKKIAAAGALVTVTLYYLISGFAVSAERAYIMMAIMLAAVFSGRPSISLRNVALSAIAILILSPSALMGPGFQMSYAATLALVAGYSGLQRHMRAMTPFSGIPVLRRLMPAGHFMAGVFMTSLIGGLSTALFSVEHFHRIATWGLPANLLTMPVISFVVMPAGLVALLLMPFGLDWLPIVIMGYGLDFVLAVAKWVAAQQGEWITGRIPSWLFIGMTASLVSMAIMRSRMRFIGAAAATALWLAYIALPSEPAPDLVIFEDGVLVGLVDGDRIALSQGKPSDFIIDQWLYALKLKGVIKPERISQVQPDAKRDWRQRLSNEEIRHGRQAMARALTASERRFTCRERHWCAARTAGGLAVVVAINGGYAGTACELADIVVTPARLKWDKCRSGAMIYTGETLRRSGSLEIRLEESDFAPPVIRVTGALDGISRDWTRHRTYDWRTDSFAGS